LPGWRLTCTVTTHWLDLPERFSNVALGAFVVMPNHDHGIIVIESYPDSRRGEPFGLRPLRAKPCTLTLGASLTFALTSGTMTSIATTGVRGAVHNPARWAEDAEHPARYDDAR